MQARYRAGWDTMSAGISSRGGAHVVLERFRVERLRTKFGGSNTIHDEPTVTSDGVLVESPAQLDSMREVAHALAENGAHAFARARAYLSA